jgi:hypothetical protein
VEEELEAYQLVVEKEEMVVVVVVVEEEDVKKFSNYLICLI